MTEVLITYKTKMGSWLYYNIITQTLIESKFPPELIWKELPENIREQLYFGTIKEELEEFNLKLYAEAKKQLLVPKDLYSPFHEHLNFFIVLWYDCNFACPYCYQQQEFYENTHTKEREIDLEKVKEIIRRKSKEGKYKPKIINILGGEPFLKGKRYKQKLSKLFDFINQTFSDIEVLIISNGYFVDKYIDILNNYSNITWSFRITLGATRDQHRETRVTRNNKTEDTWLKIVQNLKLIRDKLSKSKITIRVNMDDKVTADNIKRTAHEITKMIPNVSFHVSTIQEFASPKSLPIEFLKLAIYAHKNKNQNMFVQTGRSLKPIIDMITGSDDGSYEKPFLCNAYSFLYEFQVVPPFEIQSCERFNGYMINKDKLIINPQMLKNLEKQVLSKCKHCGFLRYCLGYLCELTQNRNCPNCYEYKKNNLLNLLHLFDEMSQ